MQAGLVEGASGAVQAKGTIAACRQMPELRKDIHDMGKTERQVLLAQVLHRSALREQAMMDEASFRRELDYQMAMMHLRRLLEAGLITGAELKSAEEALDSGFKPLIRDISLCIGLT
jgi:hypothetical protein